jgi:hypothetical protein
LPYQNDCRFPAHTGGASAGLSIPREGRGRIAGPVANSDVGRRMGWIGPDFRLY